MTMRGINEMQPDSTSPAATDRGPSVIELLTIVLQARRWTIWLPAALVVGTVAWLLVAPRAYTSTASFLPQRSNSSLGRLAGFAAQLGVAVPGQDPSQSPEFYADLVVSREILGRVVADTVGFGVDRRVPLAELLEAEGATPAAVVQDAIKRLGRRLGVAIDAKTGVVTLRATTKWPEVSAAIVEKVVAGVSAFDLHTRQTQAAAERQFAESRLAATEADLRRAEDRLEAFLARNRDYRNSPSLQFQFDRLSREVTSQQQVVTSMREGYETARVEEVRDTPRITVVERWVVPARADSRRIALRAALAGLVGIVLSWPAAVASAAFRHTRARDGGAVALLEEQARALVPWRRAGRDRA
jgi:uncharacterized protein involved in exopolysaccharide biosynthesis